MQFVCRVGTPEGRIFEETFTAADEAALKQDLEKRGFHIFAVRPRGLVSRFTLPSLRRGRRKVKTQEFMIFNQELAALVKAGLPLLQSLDIMLERMRNPELKSVLSDIRDRVASGADLSEAFAAYGDMFPRLYASSLKAGERSGELEGVLRRFIRYQKLVLEARKRVVSALVYPAVLVTLSIVMILVMAIYVMPRFTGFYADLGSDLPMLTQVTLGFSNFVRSNIWLIVLVVVGGVVVLRTWGRTDGGRVTLDRWQLELPLVGPIFHRLALSEFTRSLATLLSGGLPLVSGFEIAVGAVGNASIRARLTPTIQMVREGKAFYEALEESGVFHDMAIDMIKVGEATGALDEMLANVAETLDEQVETQLGRLLTLVEPVMLVFMGLVIALLLISLYLPMFSVITGVS